MKVSEGMDTLSACRAALTEATTNSIGAYCVEKWPRIVERGGGECSKLRNAC